MREVKLPTKNPSCVQFIKNKGKNDIGVVEEESDDLVITTAKDDQGDERSRELGGSLFRLDVGAKGVEAFKFNM